MKNIPWKWIAIGCLAMVGLVAARSIVTVGKDIYYGYDWWFHIMKDPWFYVGMGVAVLGIGSTVAFGIQNKMKQQFEE